MGQQKEENFNRNAVIAFLEANLLASATERFEKHTINVRGDITNELETILSSKFRDVFLKIVNMENQYNIFYIAKEIIDKNEIEGKKIKDMMDIESNLSFLTTILNEKNAQMNFLNNVSDEDGHIKSFDFIKDFLFLENEKQGMIKKIFQQNEIPNAGWIEDIKKEAGKYHSLLKEFINTHEKEMVKLVPNIKNNIRDPFYRAIIKLKEYNVILDLENANRKSGIELIKVILEPKNLSSINSRNIRAYKIVQSTLDKLAKEGRECYHELSEEDKISLIKFLKMNKKRLKKGVFTSYEDVCIKHWSHIIDVNDINGQENFKELYNEEIKEKGRKISVEKRMLKNFGGKEQYSRVREYSYDDLSTIMPSSLLCAHVKLDNISLFSAVTENKNKKRINFILTGKKEIVENIDLDNYLLELYDGVKAISAYNNHHYTEINKEAEKICYQALRKVILNKVLSEKNGEDRTKKKM